MKCHQMFRRSVRPLFTLALGGLVYVGTGCDQVSGIMTLVSTTAQSAVQERAQSLVEGFVDSAIDGVLPSTGGN